MTSSRIRSGLTLVALCALLVPDMAWGQSDDAYTRWGGMRDRFNINGGVFFIGHDTFALLRPTGIEIPGVDIERDTQIPSDTSDFRMEGYFRLGKRHRLLLGYLTMNRSAVTRLTGQIEWEDEVFPIDAQVATLWDTRVVTFQYRFSVFQRERVDVGLSAGLFAIKVKSGIALGDSVDDVGGDVSEQAPLPMLGLGVEWEFARGFMLRARGQYLAISISDTIDGSWGEAAAAVEWYPFESARQFGIGAGYNYADIDVKIRFGEVLRRDFEYKYEFRGPVLYAVLSF
jgi:hypothetical protein